MVVCIEVMCLTSHDHVTKPTTILSGKKCIVAIVSACLRSFRSHGKELLRCWVYKQVRERQEFKLLPFSSGTKQAIKMDCSSKPKNWMPNRNTWICNAHFLSGTKSDDPLSPI